MGESAVGINFRYGPRPIASVFYMNQATVIVKMQSFRLERVNTMLRYLSPSSVQTSLENISFMIAFPSVGL